MLESLLMVLFSSGFAEVVGNRDLAVALFRAAKEAEGWLVTGAVAIDEFSGVSIYSVMVEPPLCDGGCGGRPGNPMRMCYQCQCEAHADGWYSMDSGYARAGQTDEQIHRELDYLSR